MRRKKTFNPVELSARIARSIYFGYISPETIQNQIDAIWDGNKRMDRVSTIGLAISEETKIVCLLRRMKNEGGKKEDALSILRHSKILTPTK